MFKSPAIEAVRLDLACESFDDDLASLEMSVYEASNESLLVTAGVFLLLWAVLFKLFSKIFEWLGIGGKKSGDIRLNMSKLEKKVKELGGSEFVQYPPIKKRQLVEICGLKYCEKNAFKFDKIMTGFDQEHVKNMMRLTKLYEDVIEITDGIKDGSTGQHALERFVTNVTATMGLGTIYPGGISLKSFDVDLKSTTPTLNVELDTPKDLNDSEYDEYVEDGNEILIERKRLSVLDKNKLSDDIAILNKYLDKVDKLSETVKKRSEELQAILKKRTEELDEAMKTAKTQEELDKESGNEEKRTLDEKIDEFIEGLKNGFPDMSDANKETKPSSKSKEGLALAQSYLKLIQQFIQQVLLKLIGAVDVKMKHAIDKYLKIQLSAKPAKAKDE